MQLQRLPSRMKSFGFIFVASAIFGGVPAQSAEGGFVYVMTNNPAGNTVIQYLRGDDGMLTKLSEVPTQGLGGTGNGVGALDPLGSQDSLVLADGGCFLIAVNAGSNEVSSFSTSRSGLTILSKVPSGGLFPNRVAVHNDLVYVLNAHTPNIAGFRLKSGALRPIPGAVFSIPGGHLAKPHDIRFSPDGDDLIVTVEGTNQIHLFDLDNQGLVTGVTSTTAAGTGPFGFKFAHGGVLVNSEADSNSVSSYRVNADDTLSVISAAVPDGQSATCWISLTRDHQIAFISNTGSGTLSSYQVGGDGHLTLEQAVAATLSGGGHPIDSALSSDSGFLYVGDSALGRVVIFAVAGASLHPLGAVTGLPLTLQGIAAE